jgi:hypothetical protein
MRMKRDLREHVWYGVRTAVNVGEPLFRLGWAVVLLNRVLREAKKRFAFEMRGIRLEGRWLTFYIKPEDGKELPKIMQWIKQTSTAALPNPYSPTIPHPKKTVKRFLAFFSLFFTFF